MTRPTSTASVDELRDWVLQRVRLLDLDPPLNTLRFETPEDFIVNLYHDAEAAFRGRLGEAIVEALLVVAQQPSLLSAPDANALAYLASAIDALYLNSRDAELALSTIALRIRPWSTSGEVRYLTPMAERAVLHALARAQTSSALAGYWGMLWSAPRAELWPVALAGLRRADPQRCRALLREIVERGRDGEGFPVGEVLWSMIKDVRGTFGDNVLKDLSAMPATIRDRAKHALRDVGADEATLAAIDIPPEARAERVRKENQRWHWNRVRSGVEMLAGYIDSVDTAIETAFAEAAGARSRSAGLALIKVVNTTSHFLYWASLTLLFQAQAAEASEEYTSAIVELFEASRQRHEAMRERVTALQNQLLVDDRAAILLEPGVSFRLTDAEESSLLAAIKAEAPANDVEVLPQRLRGYGVTLIRSLVAWMPDEDASSARNSAVERAIVAWLLARRDAHADEQVSLEVVTKLGRHVRRYEWTRGERAPRVSSREGVRLRPSLAGDAENDDE